jgi:DNA-directed RNA polymerase beta subunit
MVVPLDLFESQLKAFAKPLYIRNFMNEQNRNDAPRRIHASQIGYLCVAETPAGKSIGLSKQLAYTAQITTRANDQHWARLLHMLVVPWNIDKQRVVWNGNIVGAPRISLQEVYDVLRANNQRHAAVLINEYQVTLDTSAGRYIRPVRLLSGLIGYIDPQMRESSTELRSDVMFGWSAKRLPFISHNQSPRIIVASEMAHQVR